MRYYKILIQMVGNGTTPNRWVPHCTIALTGDDESEAFFRASDVLLREFKKISGEFVSIGLVKITFPVEEIFTVNMNR